MSSPYDRARLIELFGNDTGALSDVLHAFLDTVRVADQEIRAAADPGAVARAAHRLKGASGMIGASALHQIAGAIESAAKMHDLSGVRSLHGMIGREMARVARVAGVPAD